MGFLASEVNPFLEETLALEESHHVRLHPSWEASHAWGNGLRPCLQGPEIPLSASHVLSSHLRHLHLDLRQSLMPTGGEAFAEESLPALEVNDVVSLLVLEVSLALEESDHPSIHLGRLLDLHLFQASDHSSSLLLCHHDPHPCAHFALSQAAPPPPPAILLPLLLPPLQANLPLLLHQGLVLLGLFLVDALALLEQVGQVLVLVLLHPRQAITIDHITLTVCLQIFNPLFFLLCPQLLSLLFQLFVLSLEQRQLFQALGTLNMVLLLLLSLEAHLQLLLLLLQLLNLL